MEFKIGDIVKFKKKYGIEFRPFYHDEHMKVIDIVYNRNLVIVDYDFDDNDSCINFCYIENITRKEKLERLLNK